MAAAAGEAASGAEPDLTERIMEYQRREYALLSRMARREREMRSLKQQAAEAVHSFEDRQKDSLRGAYVDPAVNIELAMLWQRLQGKDKEIARLKEESSNAQFQPNSIQGQKLLQKCKHLLEENSELGRQLGEDQRTRTADRVAADPILLHGKTFPGFSLLGAPVAGGLPARERVQMLRIQLTVERRKRLQLRQRIGEFDQHAEQVDAENERMQRKIAELGQQLKETRAEIDRHKKDIEEFRSGTKRKKEDKAPAPAPAEQPAPAPAAPEKQKKSKKHKADR